MNLHHVPFPVVLSRECPAAQLGIITALDGAMKLLLLFVAVIDVALQMRLGAEALATARILALVVLAVVSLMMPIGS